MSKKSKVTCNRRIDQRTIHFVLLLTWFLILFSNQSCLFFGKNTSEEKLCRGIGSSSVKCFLCIPTKQKLAALFFLQTLVALDTDEHRFLLRNTYGNKSWLSNTKKRRFVQTLKFWSLKKLLLFCS